MGKFTVIPQDTFEALQIDAGVLLKTFDPANPAAPSDSDIITATTGGIKPSCVPTYSDFGADVDNCPDDAMELKHLDSWEASIAFTALNTDAETIKLSLGAADVTESTTYTLTSDTAIVSGKTYYTRSGTSPNYSYTAVTTPSSASLSTYYEIVNPAGTVTPRRNLSQSDFQTIWWVGDRTDGGAVAIKMMNALSTGGFGFQTTKNGKGQLSCTLTGHVSINAQNIVPMVFYTIDPD